MNSIDTNELPTVRHPAEPSVNPSETEPTPAFGALADTGPATYSIDETASIMRISRKTVVAMIERGELPSVRYARRRWVPVRAVRELLLLDVSFVALRGDRETRRAGTRSPTGS